MLVKIHLVLVLTLISLTGFSKPGKTLLNKKLKPDIAKSYKKEGNNKFSFQIDPSKKVKSGGKEVTITFDMIEKSLMKRLGKKFDAKVTGDIKTVTVTYSKGTEKDFLKEVSKSRIRPAKAINIASSVSDGGVRARTATRDPKGGEVKASFVKRTSKDHIRVKILMKGADNATEKSNKIFKALPLNKEVLLADKTFKGLKGQLVYFFPVAQKKDASSGEMIWIGKKISKK